ncbi:MAG TPA: nuclear transport factor 2 family protein [Gaiellaceae bacterium]|nr:nuclear transport factor 2 family protein [Gaiellaceae bacterium]
MEASVSDDRSKLAVLARILDGFNRHDLDAIIAHFADDCVLETPRGSDPWGRRFEGKQAVAEGLRARFDGIPDVSYESHGDFVAGERGVSEWTLRGTTVAGERLEVRGCDLWTFRGDEVVVKNSFWKIVES